jgi:hypothetical protein
MREPGGSLRQRLCVFETSSSSLSIEAQLAFFDAMAIHARSLRHRLMIPPPPTWSIFWLLPRLGFGEAFVCIEDPKLRYRPAC